MSQKCLIFLYKVTGALTCKMVWKKNIIEIHQGAAELFAFECITRGGVARDGQKRHIAIKPIVLLLGMR